MIRCLNKNAKILVIHNKYRIFGGEDSNILDEIEILKKRIRNRIFGV